MFSFLFDVIAAAMGFALAKITSAWFDARVSHSSFIEAERSQDVHRIVENVDRLAELGVEYWVSGWSNKDNELVVRITPGVHNLWTMCRGLFEDDEAALAAVRAKFTDFDEELTGGSFAGKEREMDMDRCIRLQKAANTLNSIVRKQRRELKRKWL